MSNISRHKGKNRTSNFELIWSEGTGNKKYKVKIFKNDKKIKTVQFGDKRYQQYQDNTPLKLYSFMDHNDKNRRRLYRLRHGGKGYQKILFSPAWFSWNFLW